MTVIVQYASSLCEPIKWLKCISKNLSLQTQNFIQLVLGEGEGGGEEEEADGCAQRAPKF